MRFILTIALLLGCCHSASGADRTALPATAQIEQVVLRGPAKALAEGRQRLERARHSADRQETLAALRMVVAALDQQDVKDYLALADELVGLSEGLSDEDALLHALYLRASLLYDLRRVGDASKDAQRGLALARAAERKLHVARFLSVQAFVAHSEGRKSTAVDLLREAVSIADKEHDALGKAIALNCLAYIFNSGIAGHQQQLDSLDVLDQAISLLAEQPYLSFKIDVLVNRASLHRKLGNPERATKDVTEALEIAKRIDSSEATIYLTNMLAEILLLEHRPAEALAILNVPEALEKDFPARWFSYQVLKARALSATGQNQQGLALLAKIDRYQEGAATPRQKISFLDAYATALANAGEFRGAYEKTRDLRAAERKLASESNDRVAEEMRTRFEVEQHERRAERAELEARASRASTVAAVAGTVAAAVVVASLVLTLRVQVRQKKLLALIAFMDELTGVPNRRKILELANRYLQRAGPKDDLYICIVDIDHFKQVNDKFGHDVGDRVLQFFAETLKNNLRVSDVIGRYGGEEFILILPECPPQELHTVFDRLRHAVAADKLGSVELGRKLTFSMGASCAHAGTLEQVLKAADEALYQAKAGGRDRLIVRPCPKPVSPAGVSGQQPPSATGIDPRVRHPQRGVEALAAITASLAQGGRQDSGAVDNANPDVGGFVLIQQEGR
jgi:diguanylate cyclase (GGDEF)-like protein